MFHSKLRHVSSNSLIEISPLYHSKKISSKYSSYSHNQNRVQNNLSSSISHHHHLCHSYSHDSLDRDVLHQTKHTWDKLFHQSNFHQLLDQIQHTLQPLAEQLREKIQEKKHLSKQDRFICMKSCAKFLIETLQNDHWNIDEHFPELYQLQNFLLTKQQTSTSTQTDHQLDIDERKSVLSSKSKKQSKSSIVPPDDLTRQKHYHRSISRAFKKLNIDLQKLHHETPFQSHLSKYHTHNHDNKNLF